MSRKKLSPAEILALCPNRPVNTETETRGGHHPWKSNWIDWKKLKAAKAEYRRRQSKKRRDDGIEYFRETEKAWHKKHPNGANSGNPKFTERAIKANAAKSSNSQPNQCL